MPDETIREPLTNCDDPDPPADPEEPTEESPVSWKGNLIESIQARPGMFVGDMRDGYGLHELLRMVLEVAVAAHLRGNCSAITLEIENDGGVIFTMPGMRVEPSEVEPLLFGRRFDLTLACVTALSTSIHLDSVATAPVNGRRFEYTAVAGKAQGVELFEGTTDIVQTVIRFTPDPAFFHGVRFDGSIIQSRLRDVAALNDDLPVLFVDHRTGRVMELGVPRPRGRFFFVDSLRGDSRSLPGEADADLILAGDGPAAEASVKPPITVVFALCWRVGLLQTELTIRSFANQWETRDGGHHVAGLVRAVLSSVLKRIDANEFLTDVARHRITMWLRRQMIAFVAVTHPDPSFGGPTRSILIAPDVGPIVRAEVRRVLDAYFDENPQEIERLSVIARVW